MKPKRPRMSGRKTYYLVLWWMSQTPYAAIFENQVAAEAAANVRNALMVTISGRDVKVDQVQDWYRRDESGAPMPAEWRVQHRQSHGPVLSRSEATRSTHAAPAVARPAAAPRTAPGPDPLC